MRRRSRLHHLPVSLRVDLVGNVKTKARIVSLVVTGSTNLKDHERLALVGESEDIAARFSAVFHVIGAGTVTGLATYTSEIFARVRLLALGKAARSSVAGHMAPHAFRFSIFVFLLKTLDGMRVGALGPDGVLALMAALTCGR